MLDIVDEIHRMETLPKEATNLIIRFISHPVADVIKPQISNGGPFMQLDMTLASILYRDIVKMN